MTRNDTARLIEPARSALVPGLSDSRPRGGKQGVRALLKESDQ